MAVYYPNAETANEVKKFVRAGIPSERISRIIGITHKQLTTHYPYELGLTNEEDLAVVADVAYQMAVSGRYPDMTKFWLQQRGGIEWKPLKDDRPSLSVMPLIVMIGGPTTVDNAGNVSYIEHDPD